MDLKLKNQEQVALKVSTTSFETAMGDNNNNYNRN